MRGMYMTQLKPALTYEQQIDRLKNVHNLKITDRESALKILKKVNYYRLSAYGLGLTQKDNREKYIDGITIEHIYKLYEFDSIFRSILIRVIEQLEIQLRAQISNFLALKYGPEGYVDPANFVLKKSKSSTIPIHTKLMKDFKKACIRQRNVPFVKHHMDKYNGHFPIWVASELFTFGNLTSLYDIMCLDDRKEISQLYNTTPKYLNGWILALVEIRNICAHYGRLYNMPLKQSPRLYPEHQKYRSKSLNKIFPLLLTIKRMLNNDERWNVFEVRLEALIEEYSNVINLSFIGFPKECKEVLEN